MRPTDVCHPYDLRAPAPRAFPARSHHFRGGESPRSLGLRVALPGTWTFHDVRGRFGGSFNNRVTRALLPHGLETRAWAFSSHGDAAIEPLTPLSQPVVSPSASFAFASAASSPSALLVEGTYGSESAMSRQDHRGRRLVKSNAS